LLRRVRFLFSYREATYFWASATPDEERYFQFSLLVFLILGQSDSIANALPIEG